MKKMFFLWMLLSLVSCSESEEGVGTDTDPKNNFERSYDFQGSMPDNVLRSYLSRAITMAEFATGIQFYNDSEIPKRVDDERMLINIGAKFIGRAVYRWGKEDDVLNPEFFSSAQLHIQKMHQTDPEMIFQAAIFEIITSKVNEVPIPDWVFEAFDKPVESRNFNYSGMINTQGLFVNHWASQASVPDVSREETRMWFYYLAARYIDIGIEAIHWGQVRLIAMADAGNNFEGWSEVLDKVREYALDHARRGFVLMDGHMPEGGIKTGEKLLFDFHSFPLRIREKIGYPQEGELAKFYEDAIYGRSKGGITPSGWYCESLPYLVEFDNFGISDHPGEARISSTWVWGYDEITWFSLQPEKYRNEFLVYAFNWIHKTDLAGYLQMPGNRKIVPHIGSWSERYRVNQYTNDFEYGYSQENTIKSLWVDND